MIEDERFKPEDIKKVDAPYFARQNVTEYCAIDKENVCHWITKEQYDELKLMLDEKVVA